MLLLDELIKKDLIKEQQIQDILKNADKKYGGSVEKSLLDFNISKEEILNIKSSIFGIPVKIIDFQNISSSVLRTIPLDTVKIYKFAPIGENDNVIEIGTIDPENVQATDVLSFISSKMGKPFKLFLIDEEVYDKIVERYNGLDSEVDKALSEIDQELADTIDGGVKIESQKTSDDLKPGEEEKIVEDAPIIKIVAVIIRHATEGLASDIHIENVGDKVKVRFRVDGILYTSLVLPINVYNGVVARIKILAKLRLDEKRKPQDGGFSAKIDGRKVDFRVSTMPSYYGEKIVMRILDPQKGVYSIDKLYLSKESLDMVREALTRPYGLILITGPTGSGKTTTLYSMINELDRESRNVISLEDPVEYQMQGVNQSQVAPEIGYTFASGLRSILRQDPDIIMVGEIRDKETAELAIQAALTGHLVFSTLHTNNSIGAIPRLIDMGIDPYLIAPTLILCIAQRLARHIYPPSKKSVPMDESRLKLFEKQFSDLPEEFRSKIDLNRPLYEAVSTPECSSGLKGRVPLFEMFKVDKEMQSVILKSPTEQDIYKLARSKGLITIKEDAILKSLEGHIPLQEIYNY